jgi:hypothetical protein
MVDRTISTAQALPPMPMAATMIDTTGRATVPWITWFNAVALRLGLGSNNTISSAQAAAELAAIGADQSGDIAAAEDRIHDELAGIVDTSEGRMMALKDELRAEIAAQIDGVSNQAFRDFVNSQFEYDNSWNQQIIDSVAGVLPSQAGNADKVLSTDGTTVSWRGSYYQSSGLSTSYGTTAAANTGAFNAIMGTGASATWLLSGTSSGTFRAGIQVLDAGGSLRIYEGTNHLDFAAGALTVPSNITSGGSVVTVNGSANPKFTLANTTNSQVWSFAYNAGSAIGGVYDGTAAVFRLSFNDTTGEAKFPANVAPTTTTTGTVIVTGGVGVSGQVTAGSFKGNGAALTNLPIAAPSYQEFSATAAQTVFNTTIVTTAKAAGKAYLQIFVNGVFQQEGATKAYTVTGAAQVTFNAGLALNDDVVMYSYT